jgi:ferredoxin
MIYILGTGHSSLAALVACIEKNKEVTILDVGFRSNLNFNNSNIDVIKSKIPIKKINGSSYPYWDLKPKSFIKQNQTEAINSYSFGGFSNTWGAGVLPYSKDEFKNWPISLNEMEPYYKKLDSFLPLVAEDDNLSNEFPLYHSKFTILKSSTQILNILNKIEKNSSKLINEGLTFGKSRLAINQVENKCTYCNKCIEGCPENLIHSSVHSFETLLKKHNVKYINGVHIEMLSINEKSILIDGFDLINNMDVSFLAEKVFVGTGTISTTQLMMRSLKIYDKEIEIKDSQYFIFPILGATTKSTMNENVNTLAQIFCEVNNKQVSPNRIHLSIYGYSPFLKEYVYSVFGIFNIILKPFLNFFLKRMYVGQGFLHSEESNKLKIKLIKGEKDIITIISENDKKVKKTVLNLVRLFNRNTKITKLFGFTPFIKIAPTGKSYHIGGSMPMKKNPKEDLDTNVFGETNALPNVHIIDSSVFPDIPGGPIAYTMMANAYRIVIESINN